MVLSVRQGGLSSSSGTGIHLLATVAVGQFKCEMDRVVLYRHALVPASIGLQPLPTFARWIFLLGT